MSNRYQNMICRERQAAGNCPMQEVFVKHQVRVTRPVRMPMTYQAKLCLAFAVVLAAFAFICFAGFLVTASTQKPQQKFPDIIASQPKIQK